MKKLSYFVLPLMLVLCPCAFCQAEKDTLLVEKQNAEPAGVFSFDAYQSVVDFIVNTNPHISYGRDWGPNGGWGRVYTATLARYDRKEKNVAVLEGGYKPDNHKIALGAAINLGRIIDFAKWKVPIADAQVYLAGGITFKIRDSWFDEVEPAVGVAKVEFRRRF